jgi:hypothetical protein
MATISDLDEELIEILKPLASLGMRLAVPPHVNTLCLVYHYMIALGRAGKSVCDLIQISDWDDLDRTDPSVIRNLTSLHMFYSTKATATAMSNLKTGGAGHFNSIAVSRFRQQHVFIQRNSTNEAFMLARPGQSGKDIIRDYLTSSLTCKHGSTTQPFVMSDITGLANALVKVVTKKTIRVFHPKDLLDYFNGVSANFALWVFSAPCSEYMVTRDDKFIPVETNSVPLYDEPAYETHIIWFMPKAQIQQNYAIGQCLRRYHTRLFSVAQDEASKDNCFEGMGKVISRMLAIRHPSFASEVCQNSMSFRHCLRSYHSDPPLSAAAA